VKLISDYPQVIQLRRSDDVAASKRMRVSASNADLSKLRSDRRKYGDGVNRVEQIENPLWELRIPGRAFDRETGKRDTGIDSSSVDELRKNVASHARMFLAERTERSRLSPAVTRYVSASVAHLQCCYEGPVRPCEGPVSRRTLNMRAGVGAATRDSTRVLTSGPDSRRGREARDGPEV